MSGPKARCPSCGTEWEGPVVFCGECGSPVASVAGQGDRAARLPAAPPPETMKRANTLVGSLPAVPVSPNKGPGQVDPRRTVLGMPAAFPPEPAAGTRTPAVTMVSPVAPPADREAKPFDLVKPAGKGGGKRGRKGSSVNEEIPRAETKPEPAPPPPKRGPLPSDAPQIEVQADSGPEPTTVETGKTPAAKRPSAAPAALVRKSAPPAEVDETTRLLEDLDAGFENIVRPSAPVVWLGSQGSSPGEPPPSFSELTQGSPTAQARAARHEADMAEVRTLFAGIAVSYARPLRDFMIEVAWGEPTKDWLDVTIPAAQALRRAANAVELPEVDSALEGYITALELATGESSVHREVREMLAGAYAKLIDAMPQVFALEGELVRREPIIVRSLLLQVPGVRHVAIEKLYRAGINALDVFYAARPRELAEATGLDEEVAAAICERFQRYKREVAELSPGSDRAKERAELTAMVDTLAEQHEAHERAAKSWGPTAAADKARARKEREDTVLRIDVLLAHLGEVDLQRTIAKVPFQQKIRELRRYLDEAKQKAGRG